MKDLSSRKQYGRFRFYIIYMMLMSIVLCMCIQPLGVSALSPLPTYKQGDYLYNYLHHSIVGYVGKEKDIVTPVINDDCFNVSFLGENKNIRSVTLNAKVNKVGEGAFSMCKNLMNIYVDPDNEYFTSIDGVLFDKEGTTLIAYPQNKGQKEYQIPEGTKYISSTAFTMKRGFFDFRTLLHKIYLPDSLEEYTGLTFFKCITLKEIHIKDTNEKYTVENGIVFDKDMKEIVYYPKIKSSYYVVPEGIRKIGYYAFFNSGLRYIRLNEGLEEISEGAFAHCRLRKVIIPDTVKLIERNAFGGNKIHTLKLGKSVEKIDDGAFKSNNITKLELNDSLTYIGGHAFAWSDIKGTLIFPKSLELIGYNAFTSEEVSRVIIWDGVRVDDSLFGSEEFKEAYDKYGAGAYIWADESKWIKER